MANRCSNPVAATVALHCRATLYSHYVFQDLEGCHKKIALHPLNGPCGTYFFSSLRGCRASSCLLEGVAVQGGVAATRKIFIGSDLKTPYVCYTRVVIVLARKLPRKSCDVGLRCQEVLWFLTSSDAKMLAIWTLIVALRCDCDAKSLAIRVDHRPLNEPS